MAEKHVLDASGLMCPLPVLKLRKRLEAIAVGDELTMTATDPAAVIDVPHFCIETGHQLVRQGTEGEAFSFTIRRV